MSQTLIAGANAPLANAKITLRIISQSPIDCAAYRLASNMKVRGDGDMVFYGQRQSDDASIAFRGRETDGFFDIDLPTQPMAIEKVAVAFSADLPLAQLGNVTLQVMQGSEVLLNCPVEAANRNEKALILGECYRRQGSWKFRFIAQGFDGGLKPLSEHFGVEIADDSHNNQAQKQNIPTPPPMPNTASTQSNAAKPSVNLSKVTLTKTQSSINLKKKDNFGKISINLNWNQQANAASQATGQPKKGLLSDLFKQRASGIDLDIGAMIFLKNGERTLIQALGNHFGNLNASPYVLLRADDRTGHMTGGEWLDINGSQWSQIQEVLVFAFIYEGVPNWAQTDGIVTIHVPEQPPIETHLTEGANNRPMCAIARLVNQNGSINVERINQYFNGHQDMDKAFGWGFSWKRGSK
ncbi:TerD family protein [Psychrobacter sp. I-STPA10]|uniref:TerD family protein n=1 Tax=Psychrobacter sp. I-STPA10 TaxID=2585769 RepID=UPI003FA6AA4A